LHRVQALIAKGADVNAWSYGSTALMLASDKGHLGVVQALLAAGADVNAKTSYGSTALTVASSNGHLDVVQALLARGADVNGSGALGGASANGHLEVVQALLAKGANVNAGSPGGPTVLMAASRQGHLEVVQALLASGADVNARNNLNFGSGLGFGLTALLYASQQGHLDVVQALLAHGADVNARMNDGKTALMLAALNGHLDVVQALLKAGAELNLTTDQAATALKLAEERGHADVVEFLKSAGGVTTDAEFASIDRIVILPVIDARSDKTAKIKLDGLRKYVQKILETKHYAAVEADIAPPDARWVLVVTVTDLYNSSSGIRDATVEGILCDTQGQDSLPICGGHGSKFWSATGYGEFTPVTAAPLTAQSNVANAAAGDAMAYLIMDIISLSKRDVLASAVFNLVNSIPKQPKKRK
jgi:ankyrin repeat protein